MGRCLVRLIFIAQQQLRLPGLKTLSLTFWADIFGARDTELLADAMMPVMLHPDPV